MFVDMKSWGYLTEFQTRKLITSEFNVSMRALFSYSKLSKLSK